MMIWRNIVRELMILIFWYYFLMENELKNSREFKILYDWLQIARKPDQDTEDDIKLLMELIDIPVTPEEIRFLANALKSDSNKLEKETFLNYFFVPEEKKKQT